MIIAILKTIGMLALLHFVVLLVPFGNVLASAFVIYCIHVAVNQK